MANLTKVEMVVERVVIEGVTYERTDDSAKVGDIIRIGDEDIDFLTDGGYYEVVRIDSCGDPQIIDDDGDEYDTANLSDVYTVFRRVDGISKAAEPYRLPGDYVIHDGRVYRKEARMARVGEKVVITKSDTFGRKVGSVLTAERMGGFAPIAEDGYSLFSPHTDNSTTEDYRVLVPVNTVTIDGVDYRFEKRPATKGERVLVVNNDTHWILVGEVATAVSAHVIRAEQSQFIDSEERPADGDTQYVDEDDYLILVPSVENDCLKVDLAVGDYAKVGEDVCDGYAKTGDIVEIFDVANLYDFKVRKIGDTSGKYTLFDRESLTRVTDEEVRQANEAAKWSAIGRRVGEIRKGDIVRITKRCGSPLKEGSIHEVSRPYPGSGAYIDGWAVECELVAPVESRFDAAQ